MSSASVLGAEACQAEHAQPVVPDPVLTTAIAHVHAALMSVIRASGTAKLIGRPGAGKTTMLHALSAALRRGGVAASVLAPGDNLPGRSHVVLMDDAHLLEPGEWQRVTSRKGPLVLAGLPSLLDRRPASRRRMPVMELPPVAPDEVPAFVAGVLRQVGEPPAFIPVASIAALCEHTGRLPGRIAVTVRLSVFVARLEGAVAVEPAHVAQAARLAGAGGDQDADEPATVPLPVQRQGRLRFGLVAAAAAMALTALSVPLDRIRIQPRSVPSAAGPDGRTAVALQTPPAAANLPEAAATVPVQPPAPPAPALPPFPTSPRLYVTVSFAVDDPGARALGMTIEPSLRDQGYSVSDPEPARVPPGGVELHYWFAEDAEAADGVARAVGASPQAVRMVDMDPRRPRRPGSAEILIGRVGRQDR